MMIEWDVLIHVMAERRRDPYEADSRQGPNKVRCRERKRRKKVEKHGKTGICPGEPCDDHPR